MTTEGVRILDVILPLILFVQIHIRCSGLCVRLNNYIVF